MSNEFSTLTAELLALAERVYKLGVEHEHARLIAALQGAAEPQDGAAYGRIPSAVRQALASLGEASAGEVARHAGLSPQQASGALRRLVAGGLAVTVARGRYRSAVAPTA